MQDHWSQQAAGAGHASSLGKRAWALEQEQHMRAKIFLASHNYGTGLRREDLGGVSVQQGEGRRGDSIPLMGGRSIDNGPAATWRHGGFLI